MTTVWHTTDAGRQWVQQLAVNGEASSGEAGLPAAHLSAIDDRTAMLLAFSPPELFLTTDAGAHWQSRALPGAVEYLIGGAPLGVLNAKRWWLLADVRATMGQSTATIYLTEDAGRTWTRLAFSGEIVGPSQTHGIGTGGDKLGIAFADDRHGWITANSGGGPDVYRSGDGGATWSDGLFPPAPTTAGLMGRSGDAAGCYCNIGASAPVTRGATVIVPATVTIFRESRPWASQMAFYTSGVGATTWRVSSEPLLDSDADPPLRWQIIDASTWVVAGGSALAWTHDAGTTWIAKQTVVPGGERLAQLDFVSATEGWAISVAPRGPADFTASSHLLRTDDEGSTWTDVPLPAIGTS